MKINYVHLVTVCQMESKKKKKKKKKKTKTELFFLFPPFRQYQ